MSADTGGFASPCEQGHIPDGTWNQTFEPGMTLLDHFAGLAMQSICGRYDAQGPCYIAELSYDTAAAMIAEKRRREAE